ncbi:MAG TPA: Zn-ribbon containing protein [Halococcus sp.]|nr:Zn-ribbon containing protein [Halococcus sp.]
MPHQCTQCGHTFPDGSKEMLSGCPDCGGNKFQFQPATDTHETESAESSSAQSIPDSGTATELSPEESTADEDRAQTDARREVASGEELAAESEDPESDSTSSPQESTDSETESDLGVESDEDSTMAALRRELNDQFESIKIIEPGQYELNLMELYNREEYIIALQEDGQYVIEVPESWLGDN